MVATATGWGGFCASTGEGEGFVWSGAGATIADVTGVVVVDCAFGEPPRGIPRAINTRSTIRAMVSRSGTAEGAASAPDAAMAATTADAAEIVDFATAAMAFAGSAGEAENDAPAIR